jgi:uncharacterized membrane protein
MVIASRKEPKVVFVRVFLCVSVAVIKMKYLILYIASFAFSGVGACLMGDVGTLLLYKPRLR